MSQVIGLTSKYIPLLDELYRMNAKTSLLDANANLVREGMTANSIYIPDIVLQGLGDYSASDGFVGGEATFTWRQHTFTQDRGRTFSIDAMENLETVDVAFGSLVSQFVKQYVVPEVDAYRIAKLATAAIGNSMTAGAALDATTTVEALDVGLQTMADNEVNMDNVVVYVTPATLTKIKQSDQFTRMFDVQSNAGGVQRNVISIDGHPLIVVPSSRMYSQITLKTGGTDQEAGGYVKTISTGKDLNFLIVDPDACFGITKTAMPRVFAPEVNQTKDAWKFDYRLYHDLFVSTAKLDGIYAHTTT